MTSQINPNDIDGNYPIAGVSNNTQGMRDNFTNTRTNFQYASDEITDLQSKALLKAALTGTTLDNNLANNVMYNAQIRGFSGTTVAIANTSGTINIDCNAGHYQSIYMAGNISLGFDSNTWPTAGTAGMVRTQITVDQAGRTMALPVAVSNGVTGIQGFSSNVITFAQAGTYEFGFLTTTGGSNITIFDLNRPLNYYTNDVTVVGNVVSGQNFIGNGSLLTGITANAGPVITNGTSNIAVLANANIRINVAGSSNVAVFASTGEYVTGVVSATGNVTGGNVLTAGVVSSLGNIISGNILTAGVVSSAGNINGAYFIGNGSQLTGVTQLTQIVSGTTQLAVDIPSGNIQATFGPTANVIVFTPIGANFTGYVNATGNITGANATVNGLVTATGNVTGGNLRTGGTISATGNVTCGFINATGNVSLTGNVIAGNLTTSLQVVALGNITGGNILSDGQLSTTANISGNNITAVNVVTTPMIVTNNIRSDDSSFVNIEDGVNVTGAVDVSGNIRGGNLITSAAISAASVSASGNVTGGNILGGANVNATTHTGTTVSVSGNITGGNVLSGAVVSAVGAATILSGTAVPAGGTTGAGYKFSSVANLGVFFGSGAPTLSAAQGSLYLRTDGSSTSTRMYVNTNGSTTWTAVTTAA